MRSHATHLIVRQTLGRGQMFFFRCFPVRCLADILATSRIDSLPLWIVLHGSAERYGSDRVLLATMSALRNDPSFRPVVVLHEDGPLRADLVSAGVEVHVANVTKIRRSLFSPSGVVGLVQQFAATSRLLDNVAADRRIGLVYTNTLAVLGGAYWARRRRLPHVWHVHEIIRAPALARWGLPRLAGFLSKVVLANSRQTQIWLEQEAPSLKGKVTIAFNGLAQPPYASPEAVASFRERVGASSSHVIATLVGRFNHMKGQPLLVQALSRLKVSGMAENLRIVLVGDVYVGHQDYRAQCEELVNMLGLNDQVVILPFQDDIGPVWHGSDIAVVASTEPESFGMVAIEAMACGLPVVAAAHGGLLDIVEDQITGLLFRPNDVEGLAQALQQLGLDPGLRQRMGTAGARRQRDHFSLAAQTAQIRQAGTAVMTS